MANQTSPNQARAAIEAGQTFLGIELGSTRIKAVLIDARNTPIATGGHTWENQYVDRNWTYSDEAIWSGLQACYADLAADVAERYQTRLTTLGALGLSAMMHGYLAFDAADQLLVPFRTWRNTSTAPAAAALTELFDFNVPIRWSVAHLYQAICNQEPHVAQVDLITTLSGYVHWRLTGEPVLGVGDASGMFPIDSHHQFDPAMLAKFTELVADRHLPWTLPQILPRVLDAGQPAGRLTEQGARLLDPTGVLQAGVPLCPPEGDAGTGMVATNAVAPRTGNVSVGTSIFAMVVLEHELASMHPEIDLVTTPAGDPVAMIHANNCSSDLNAWVSVLGEAASALGATFEPDRLYATLLATAMAGDADCGGLLSYNYLSGEPITGLEEGRPLLVRTPEAKFTLANLMRVLMVSSFATLKIGMDILDAENVRIDTLLGHGGLFRTKGVAQQILATALDTPVSVGSEASEGGAWGMALLARYLVAQQSGQSLTAFLDDDVFVGAQVDVVVPDPAQVAGFDTYLERYRRGLAIERTAVENL